MEHLFEDDNVILDKDENDEYRLSFFKDGHYKSEEHYPFYGFTPWANRLPDCDVFGIDWEGPQGCGRVEFVMSHKGGRSTLHTEGMRPVFVKELLNQFIDECIVEE